MGRILAVGVIASSSERRPELARSHSERHTLSNVGASLLAMNWRTPRGVRFPALSFTTIVGTPPGAGSLLQVLR